MTAAYGFGTSLPTSYEDAIARVREVLKAEGFGVLTEIDVKKTLKEKIDVDSDPYIILGACNPHLAHRALTADTNIGLLLPCNVVVRAEGSGSRVEFVDPIAMMGVVQNEPLQQVAIEAREKLQRALAALSATS